MEAIAMPVEQYHRIPRRLGYKYEYWDGKAQITPYEHVVEARLEVTPRAPVKRLPLLPPVPADAAALVALFVEAFQGTPDCHWMDEARLLQFAEEAIDGYFDGERGAPLGASRVALGPGEGAPLIGAALLVREDDVPLLDMLFVAPRRQRQSIATALTDAAVGALHDVGETVLVSRYWLANAASRNWHHGYGFEDVLEWLNVQHGLAWIDYELWRREEAGDLSDAERARMEAQWEEWYRQLVSLERERNLSAQSSIRSRLHRRPE